MLRSVLEAGRTAAGDLARRPAAAALAAAAMAIAAACVAAFLVMGQGLGETLRRVGSEAVIEVYLRDVRDDAAVAALGRSLESLPAVRQVERITPERALAEFRALYPDLGRVDELLGTNPFSGSLRVVPASPDPGAAERIVAAARSSPLVRAVRYDREWIAALADLGGALRWAGLVGGTLLVLAALVTIGVVVRLALDDKRDEVALMRLVGAEELLVIAPVYMSGFALGLAGAALAVWGVGALRRLALSGAAGGPLDTLAGLLLGRGFSAGQALLFAAAGAVAGALAARIACRSGR
ncbi:MAG: permease-like cell division protein FtsX [Acidobacteria bacterium]|nr:permease-like cell division protein FtsX [Acidobacteriota bacterium]